ncbi:acetyl esterase/lipase [Lederbergia galactosidilyticus]|uniref:alpha/beta hydrolase n=1 Tax=Lederbergia galactosidilytica TaxID=217031 RepID=UPI001AE577E1|nr:alpha/beta hydrolase [Lederbergia galactosidilytica]MBP1916753.1 acetyl esterase/lipase [Lederbergia galactosidilytica]
MKKKFTYPFLWGMLGLGMLILGTASLVLVNFTKILHIFILILFVSQLTLSLMKRGNTKFITWLASSGTIVILLELVFLLHYHYILLCVNAFAAIIMGFLLLVFSMNSARRAQTQKGQQAKRYKIFMIGVKSLGAIAGVLMVAIVGFIMLLAVSPKLGIHLFFDQTNSYHPEKKSTETVMKDGTLYINDIQYGTKYPNSFLDIYISHHDRTTVRPTYIFIHGGGFVTGDKVEEDKAGRSEFDYYTSFTNAGYNVVSINYAFAPEYAYPTPMSQISEAITFLKTHANEYGLDMEKVILGGSSAGGHIIGQFAMIQTDQDYAQEMKIPSVLAVDSIKGIIFNSALFEPTKFAQSKDSWLKDYLWSIYGRAYWGNDYETNQYAKQADLVKNVTNNYPPVFISDGNTASFYKQASAFDKKLAALGIEHQFNYYEKKVATLPHGYEVTFDQHYAQKNMKKMLGFVGEQFE